MAQKIIRLPEAVIHQIAAGEVVENLASVAKELIENSLDAHAHSIEISLFDDGVEVADDGCGMSPEDALLSLERHATSKIRSAEELFSLSTMGFRGEALAAIAAVSRLHLKTSEGGMGTAVFAEGGKVIASQPEARNRGTTVSVRSLFFNVPARQKFQKSPSISRAQAIKVIETLALAHPAVTFSLKSEQKTVLYLPPQTERERIEMILGPFPHLAIGHRLWGLLSAPEEARKNRRNQYLFINRRPVFFPLISRAVQMGYGTRLPENSYPPFVLFLEIDPADVDVNVHPQKREVRFRQDSALFRSVEEAVANAFSPPASFSQPLSFYPPPFSLADAPLLTEPVREETSPFSLLLAERPLVVLGSYFLFEKEGLFLVDLPGAQARLLFEALEMPREEKQLLLYPLEVPIEDLSIIEEWPSLGIEARSIGKKKIAIDALPPWLEASHFPSFVAAWEEGKNLQRLSCRFCRGIKKRYSLDEAIHLWAHVQKCRDSLYDPLGRRIWAKVEEVDLEHWLRHGAIR